MCANVLMISRFSRRFRLEFRSIELRAKFAIDLVSSRRLLDRARRFSATRDMFRGKAAKSLRTRLCGCSYYEFCIVFHANVENRRRKRRQCGFVRDNRSRGYANFDDAAHTEEKSNANHSSTADSNEESTLPMNSYRSFRIN